MHLRATIAVLASAALGLAACGQAEEAGPGATEAETTTAPTTTAPTTPTGTGTATATGNAEVDAEAALDQTCTNDEFGYTIAYPAGWSVNQGGVIAACSAFDPGSVDLAESTEIPLSTAVIVNRTSVPLDRLKDAPGPLEVEQTEDLTIAGQPALSTTGTATGQGLVPEGTQVHRIVVALGEDEGSLLLSTYSEGDADFDAKATILDRMAETLELVTATETSTG